MSEDIRDEVIRDATEQIIELEARVKRLEEALQWIIDIVDEKRTGLYRKVAEEALKSSIQENYDARKRHFRLRRN